MEDEAAAVSTVVARAGRPSLRRRALAAATLAVILIIGAAAVATMQDVADHAGLTTLHSTVANAVDTGEITALKAAAAGRTVHRADIAAAIDFVKGGNDGMDFRLISLLRLRLGFAERLEPDAAVALDEAFAGARYWMIEPGTNAAVYWTENHQVVFAASELLAGQLLPDVVFRDGRPGAAHAADARERLRFWLDQRRRYGFSEWNSHYYTEDAAALANLVDFAADPVIRTNARSVLGLLLLDIATHTINGEFIAASSRLYGRNRMDGDGAIRRIVAHAFSGADVTQQAKDVDVNFLLSGYVVPPVLAAIATDTGGSVVERSEGRDVADVAGDPSLTGDRRIMALWGMGAITNPESIESSFDFIRAHGLLVNRQLAPFRQIDYRVLRAAGLLPWISRALDLPTNGIALQHADIYGYRTPAFAMSTAQAYQPGTFGNQEAVFQLTLDAGVTIFHGHPAAAEGDPAPNGNSPDYWTGDGYLPVSCQERAVNVSVYDLPDKPGFGRSPVQAYTHLHLPFADFDEVVIDGTRTFARRGDAFVAITAGAPLRRAGTDELIQDGLQTFWVVEASTSDDESFEGFKARVRAARLSFDGRSVTYEAGGPPITASMADGCSVDGALILVPYPRWPTRYVTEDADGIHIAFGGHEADLRFDPGP